MPKLSSSDNLKILRSEFKEVKLQTFSNTTAVKSLEQRVRIMETELNDFETNMEKSLFTWKSEIHDLIDQGFTSKAKAHDEEITLLNLRTLETREKVDKLETIMLNN
jgi:hypothetical protein